VPICIKCDREFPDFITTNGKRKDIRKRKHCPRCVPLRKADRTRIRTTLKRGVRCATTCRTCGKYFVTVSANGVCPSCIVRGRRIKSKLKAIDLLGGSCEYCGYARSPWALDFHHVDPATKSFRIANNWANAWREIEAEVKKCVLLCKNCHAELHAEMAGKI
jgi:RNase P subunit RPR2